MLSIEQSCAIATNKQNCCSWTVVRFHTRMWCLSNNEYHVWITYAVDFKLNHTSDIKTNYTFLIGYCPLIDSVLSHMVVVLPSVSLSGIHFVLIVVSPCRVQRIQLTTLLQLALNTSPRYCTSPPPSLCSLLSSLSLTFFLSFFLLFWHSFMLLKNPCLTLCCRSFMLNWVSSFI